MSYTERESWLYAASELIQQDIFQPAGIPAIDKPHRLACGFPIGYRGSKSGKVVLGQAFDPSISADGTYEVFVNPILSDPSAVLPVLVHELLHVHAGIQWGHRGAFSDCARKIGLVGKTTEAHAGPELAAALRAIAETIGEYPHASIDPSARKKQGTRLLKLQCSDCDWTARLSRKQADRLGPQAVCPCCEARGTLVVESNNEESEEN